ncbi:alpha/beta hydrolase [Planobispora siamensis]|uniref:DUF1023 domain-containing protein n=1 Tax=Planobispora siamensis TaxID=936338 RepID=A0A8J3WPD8_9ACTN|nr:alpha/beta hydrolase [Planobispora siamensis]GIH97098.1 hypothetical protein Psi01_77280 [Planobispora siamensis]
MSETDAGREAAGEAFRRVAALAGEHRADLDAVVRSMNAHAWVGGGAPRFGSEAARHRTAVQCALEAALASFARLIVRRGGTAPAVPEVRTSLAMATSGHGTYRAVDPRAMTMLVSCLSAASERLAAAGERLHAELTGAGLDGEPARPLARAGEWAGQGSGDLRRRLALVLAAEREAWLPASVTGFEVFGGSAGDPLGVSGLLDRVAAGDGAALAALLALQDQGIDGDLAGRVNAWWRGLPVPVRDRLVHIAVPGQAGGTAPYGRTLNAGIPGTEIPGTETPGTEIPGAGIGALDGVPAVDRDRANRLLLAAEKARLTAELDRLPLEVSRLGEPSLVLAREAPLKALAKIGMVERALSPGDTGRPHAYLLGMDLTGLGRIIVSWGDPDTARTTVTYVPGLGSRLSGFIGDIERARALWRQAQDPTGSKDTAENGPIASIAWLDYTAPQIDGSFFLPDRSVATDLPAVRGARALAAFHDGLRAAHSPAVPARCLVLGHSYGSLVTGKAARMRPGRLADELVLIGSPGVGVAHAAQLGLPADRVWVGEAGNDIVADLGRFSHDPGHRSFGARRFHVERSVLNEAHSSYWDPGSVSLRNLAAIVNGRPGDLVRPRPNERAYLLMPEMAPNLPEHPDPTGR